MSNSSANDDDEWEKAELSLEAMKLNESKAAVKSAGTSAPRFNVAPSLATEGNANSGKFTPGSSASNVGSPLDGATSTTEMVDSALVNALGNPRERMVVFQIENTILNFVKSSQDRTLDFPPQYNSFRRLIAYRIGQRFGLTHAQSEATNENGERGITLFKTPGYRIPNVLLIDLNIPVQQDGDSNDTNNNYSEAGTLIAVPVNPPSGSAAAAPPTKKFQVMKRAVPTKSETDSQKGSGSRKEQLSAEDKERAYSQARARIFGEEPPSPSPSATGASTTGSATGAAEETGDGSTGRASGASSRQPTPPVQTSARNSHTSSPQPAVTAPGAVDGIAAPVKRVTSDTQLSTSSTGSTGNTSSRKDASPVVASEKRGGGSVSASSWKGNKSQTRDLQAERGDPDFARSKTTGRGGATGYNNQNNSGSSNNPNSGFGGPQQYNQYAANQQAQQQQYFQQQHQQQFYYAQQQQQQQQMGYPPMGYMDPGMYPSAAPAYNNNPVGGGNGGYGPPHQQAGLRLAPTLGEMPPPVEQQYYQQAPQAGMWMGPPPGPPGPYNMAAVGGLHVPPPGAAVPGGYYPSMDPYSQQQQQPPPSDAFYDYSYLAQNKQQQYQQAPQQQHQQQGGRGKRGNGSQQTGALKASEFPPLG